MKNKFILCLTALIGCSVLLASCNSEPIIGPKGEQGEPGASGVSVLSIEKTSSDGLVDTYTITYSDGNTSTFTVTNGQDGQSIKGDPGDNGHTPVITIGNNGNWFVDDVDTGIKAQGAKGDDGLTPYIGENGNWWIGETDTEIKAEAVDGVSIESSFIDDNGDLIVVLSNGNIINAGHIKDTSEHTVKFYCDDLLVDTQYVKHGEKVEKPELEDFIVKHWYIDREFEYEWLWYGCVVTEDMSLYGDYQAIPKLLSFDNSANIEVDEYGFGTVIQNDKEISVSKAIETADYLTTLEDRGILFNKAEIGLIDELNINISAENFVSAKLYYGNSPLSFENSIDLVFGNNSVALDKAEYFTVQNTGTEPISVNSLNIVFEKKTVYVDESLPSVIINTKNGQAVTSRTQYVTCDVSTSGADKDVSNLKAQIKVRGNSTSNCPKKPYRIKLDKKNSLFGYTKAKNWSLLAEYMDGSNMHNYSALKFAKMIRGEDTFAVDPLHVNVILNGENIGIYTFCEHIDVKEGRLNIEQDNVWEKSFDEINFYIERDLSTAQDSSEIEGITYFKVDMEDYTPAQFVFALKYPEKEDFEEELEGGEVDTHEEEFQAFFSSLKDYMTDICNKFVAYSKDKTEFSNIALNVDVQSLAEYAIIDQAFRESDHNQKSFKMYRSNCGLLKFGPNWDYDSCAYGLPYQGTYVLNPFSVGYKLFESTYFGEQWGYMLFNDTDNGKILLKNIWNNVSNEMIENFLNDQFEEIVKISQSTMFDCERWMHNQYYCVFDNQLYHWKWIDTQLRYLKNYYSNL